MPDNPLSAIAEAFYKPKIKAVGVNDKGEFVDASGAPTSLYEQPGFFQRALNPNAQQIQNLNARASASPLEFQQRNKLQNNQLIADFFSNSPESTKQLYGNNPLQWLAMTGGTPQNWSALKPQITDAGSVDTGLLGNIGAVNTSTANNQALTGQMLSAGGLADAPTTVLANHAETLNQLARATGVDRKQIALLDATLTHQLGRVPMANELSDAMQNNALNEAKTIVPAQQNLIGTQVSNAQNIANVDARNAGLIANTRGLGLQNESFGARFGVTPLQYKDIAHVPETGLYGVSMPSSNSPAHSGYINPIRELIQQVAEMNLDMKGNKLSGTSPSGTIYGAKPSDKPTLITPPRELGDPHIAIDQHNEAIQTQHDAETADIKAKMAILKAQQKKLEAEHTRSGVLPVAYQQQLNNRMNPYNLIGSATSNWHPIQRANKILTGAGDVLIGQ